MCKCYIAYLRFLSDFRNRMLRKKILGFNSAQFTGWINIFVNMADIGFSQYSQISFIEILTVNILTLSDFELGKTSSKNVMNG